MNWIKELYKLEIEPVTEPRHIQFSLLTATTLTTAIGFWRGHWGPAVVAGLALILSLPWPRPMGWVLTQVKKGVALAIHSVNLGLLALAYLLVVTPLGFAMRYKKSGSEPWRQAPTEEPGPETFLRPY